MTNPTHPPAPTPKKTAEAKKPKPDALPPHSIEAEQGVLGCVLQSPQALNDCLAAPETMRMFYDLRHQSVYEAMVRVFDRHGTVDPILLTQDLADHGELERVGGAAFISSLPDLTPAGAGINRYLGILREKYILRNAIRAARKIIDRAMAFNGRIDEFIDRSERELMAAASAVYNEDQLDIRDLVRNVTEELDAVLRGERKGLTGVSTGFPDLDRMLDGLLPGNMLLIAGLPGQGKTSLAMTIADHVAGTLKIPVGVFSLEMTSEQLVTRSICARARVNLQLVRDGVENGDRVLPRLSKASVDIASSPLHLSDISGLTALQFTARARRMIQRHKVRVFIIDYLQLMETDSRSENRQVAMSEIARALKVFAIETGTTVIALAQLSRDVEKTRRKPTLADLRESAAPGHHADSAVLLWNPDEADLDNIDGVIAKNRHGSVGSVQFAFMRQYTRFDSCGQAILDHNEPAAPYRDD